MFKEKESLVVVYGLEQFDPFTYGRQAIVESDHKALQAIVKKQLMDAPKRLKRMLLRLQRYMMSVVFNPGGQLLSLTHCRVDLYRPHFIQVKQNLKQLMLLWKLNWQIPCCNNLNMKQTKKGHFHGTCSAYLRLA